MKNVSDVCMKTTLLGQQVSCPVGVAPTGYHALFDPGGEKVTAEGNTKILQNCLPIQVLSAMPCNSEKKRNLIISKMLNSKKL